MNAPSLPAAPHTPSDPARAADLIVIDFRLRHWVEKGVSIQERGMSLCARVEDLERALGGSPGSALSQLDLSAPVPSALADEAARNTYRWERYFSGEALFDAMFKEPLEALFDVGRHYDAPVEFEDGGRAILLSFEALAKSAPLSERAPHGEVFESAEVGEALEVAARQALTAAMGSCPWREIPLRPLAGAPALPALREARAVLSALHAPALRLPKRVS